MASLSSRPQARHLARTTLPGGAGLSQHLGLSHLLVGVCLVAYGLGRWEHYGQTQLALSPGRGGMTGGAVAVLGFPALPALLHWLPIAGRRPAADHVCGHPVPAVLCHVWPLSGGHCRPAGRSVSAPEAGVAGRRLLAQLGWLGPPLFSYCRWLSCCSSCWPCCSHLRAGKSWRASAAFPLSMRSSATSRGGP